MRPWAERWEQRLDCMLLTEEEQGEYGFKFSLEALLRGDAASRGAFYQLLFNMGAITPNEIRAKEEMNPHETGGDQAFVQVNLMPLDQAAEPFGAMDQSLDRALGGPEETRLLRAPATEEEFEERTVRSVASRRRIMAAYRRLMEEAAGRIVNREVQDLRRIIAAVDDGDVDEFLRRVELFADGLPPAVRTIMGPVLDTYIELVATEASDEVELEEVPQESIDRFRSSYVDRMSEGHTSETVGRLRDTALEAEGDAFANVRRMLDRWQENRAAEMGAAPCGGGRCGRGTHDLHHGQARHRLGHGWRHVSVLPQALRPGPSVPVSGSWRRATRSTLTMARTNRSPYDARSGIHRHTVAATVASLHGGGSSDGNGNQAHAGLSRRAVRDQGRR